MRGAVVALVGVALAAALVADAVASGPARPLLVAVAVAAFAAGATVTPWLRSRRPGVASARRHHPTRRSRAEARRDCERSLMSVRSMGRVAEQVAGGDSASFVVLDVARTLVELLDLEDCRYEPGGVPTGRPVLRHGGEMELWGVRWSPVMIGLPEKGFEIEMVALGLAVGRFVCLPRRRGRVQEDRVLAALALVDQAASAQLIERVP
jgi:hypothetical protein